MDKKTTEYTTEFDLKAVLKNAEGAIKRDRMDYQAVTSANKAFEAMYPKVAEPVYTPVHKLTPKLIDHSMGYVGVSFRDEVRNGRQYTLVFSKANEMHEVYMEHDDLVELYSQVHAITQQGIRAQEARRQYQLVYDAWKSADSLRRDAMQLLDGMARRAWKRLKKKGDLVESDEDGEEVPF